MLLTFWVSQCLSLSTNDQIPGFNELQLNCGNIFSDCELTNISVTFLVH